MKKNFQTHINTNLSFLNESKLIVAISGGIDSVVLTHLCQSLNFNFALAHCNFNLRNEESNKDESFVTELAEKLNVEVFIQNFDTKAYANEHKCSIQMAARELRYTWFKELAAQLNFQYILTAHHADDNLETFLINFTRGTGLNGLTGIPMVNDNVVRPLLPFSRDQIEAFAKQHHIDWREDASNASRKYFRNKLRHDIIPILKTINPQLLDSFQKTLNHLNDTALIVQDCLDDFIQRAMVSQDDFGTTYKISEFKKTTHPKAYLFEVFKNYGFTEWNDVLGLLDAQSGKLVKSNSHRLIKHREFLILTDLADSNQSALPFLIHKIDEHIEVPFGVLSFTMVEAVSTASNSEIYIDKEVLKFPLELRPWKEGDTFQPIGMKGKKKVSKFLKDEKASLVEKENTWVLTSDNKIVWVVNKRADERFKVTKNTKTIIKVTV